MVSSSIPLPTLTADPRRSKHQRIELSLINRCISDFGSSPGAAEAHLRAGRDTVPPEGSPGRQKQGLGQFGGR